MASAKVWVFHVAASVLCCAGHVEASNINYFTVAKLVRLRSLFIFSDDHDNQKFHNVPARDPRSPARAIALSL